jgi:hypothetical protein
MGTIRKRNGLRRETFAVAVKVLEQIAVKWGEASKSIQYQKAQGRKTKRKGRFIFGLEVFLKSPGPISN